MCQTFSKQLETEGNGLEYRGQLETEGNGSEYRGFPIFSPVRTFISGCIN